MKLLLLFSKGSQSIYKIFENELKKEGHSVKLVDPSSTNYKKSKVIRYLEKVNENIRDISDSKTSKIQNDRILKEINDYEPNIIISYNDSGLLPETVREISKISKLVFFLGDNPFYSFYKKNFLDILIESDMVFTPDSRTKIQLEMIGLKNVYYANIGMTNDIFYKIEKNNIDEDQYSNDIIFIGGQYNLDSWALKRALLLNEFIDFDFRMCGRKMWLDILEKFPLLKQKFTLQTDMMSFEELNKRMNYSKIYPIDHHPGIINGIHARVFDAIASGIMPLVEYRKDIKHVFKDVKIPTFKNYAEVKGITKYYLKNNSEREGICKELYEFTSKEMMANKCIKNILTKII